MNKNINIIEQNQIPIILHKDSKAAMNTVVIGFKIGSRHELPEENGLSHFLEHMAFKGTKTRKAADISKEIEYFGGIPNACTSHEFTMYYISALPEHTKKVINILTDILENSTYDLDEIKLEREVILQEIKLYEDQPFDVAQEDLYKNIFKDYSLARPILGTKKTIEKFNTKTFQDFVRKHYTKENMVISVYGSFDQEEVLHNFQNYTKNAQSGEESKLDNIQNTYSHINYIDRDFVQNSIILSYLANGYDDITSSMKQKLFSILMGSGMSSRLFLNVREKKGLTYGIFSSTSEYRSVGLFNIYSSTENNKMTKLYQGIQEEIVKFQNEVTISQKELEKAKNLLKSYIVLSNNNISCKASKNLISYINRKKILEEKEIFKLIDKITTKDITETGKSILKQRPNIVVVGKDATKLKLTTETEINK